MKRMIAFLLLVAASWTNAQPYLRPGNVPIYPEQRRESLLWNHVTADYYREFDRINKSAARLAKRWGTKHEEIVGLINTIYTNATFLRERWDDWFRNEKYPKDRASFGDQYLEGLAINAKLLKEIEKEKDYDQAVKVLRVVAADLRVKGENCRNSADGLGREVGVVVCTKNDGQEASGFEVWYVPLGMLSVEGRHRRFDKLSSPTDRTLSPGVYALWLKRNNEASDPVPMEIGGKGDPEIQFDLPVPQRLAKD